MPRGRAQVHGASGWRSLLTRPRGRAARTATGKLLCARRRARRAARDERRAGQVRKLPSSAAAFALASKPAQGAAGAAAAAGAMGPRQRARASTAGAPPRAGGREQHWCLASQLQGSLVVERAALMLPRVQVIFKFHCITRTVKYAWHIVCLCDVLWECGTHLFMSPSRVLSCSCPLSAPLPVSQCSLPESEHQAHGVSESEWSLEPALMSVDDSPHTRHSAHTIGQLSDSAFSQP